MTRYAYDAQTFRLTRLCTEQFSNPEELIYRPDGGLLQDFAYEFDLVGSITSITDPALRLLASAGNALLRRFEYDPLYRLHSATGRECNNIAAPALGGRTALRLQQRPARYSEPGQRAPAYANLH